MANPSALAYHLRELAIALDPQSPLHAMPDVRGADRAVLDIGCGIGQTLAACGTMPGRRLVGLDVDRECLDYGARRFAHIDFVVGTAERLPFQHGAFDLAVSRVALPYSDLGRSLDEIARVLAPDGRVWLTLHPFATTWSHFVQSLRGGDFRDVVFRGYVMANGLLFHCLGRQLRFPFNQRCESFQTVGGMRRGLRKAGFTDIHIQRGRHFLCTARKRAGD
ncbi:methyltransferase domain-containing protein [Lysobacter sp. H21R4]|uniref:class I SAM-dependent methyltransferase n=1 Tax=Lysobacter sp. H21R4 TaxID=2781021 RepID=UPI0018875A49|nr:class I SAM-dependent methyltransferase [Lysobacter sp. H21R4]QOY61773.1 methyltransferase domain-containing protein [Lysobacter sp. H21R4]